MNRSDKISLFCRIEALVAAYCYEILDSPIMLDNLYDKVVAPAAENTNGKKLGLYDDIVFDKSTGQWVPRDDSRLHKLSELVIVATKHNRDEIVHYPEMCVLIKEVYGVELWD